MEEKEARQEPQKQQNIGYKRYNSRRKRYHHRPNQSSQSERSKSSFKKISIVIPLFNEEESIIPLSHELRKALSRLNTNYEVILVDDGSTDSSLQKLKEITKTDNRFKYFSFRKNYGKSAALQVGFRAATGDAVVTMDADLQDDPQEIQNLLKKLEAGFDLCSGWKKKRQDPFIKKISSKFFNFVTRVISGIKIHDFNCGLKAYKKEVVENVKVYGELHRYIPVLAKWQGYTVTEVPVMHHPRRYGKTKFGITRFFKGFIDLVTVTFVTRYIKTANALLWIFGGFIIFDWFCCPRLFNNSLDPGYSIKQQTNAVFGYAVDYRWCPIICCRTARGGYCA